MFSFAHSVLLTTGCLGFIFLALYWCIFVIYYLIECKNRKKVKALNCDVKTYKF